MPSLEDPSTSSKQKRNKNMSDHDPDYSVGYGKPPQHARFHQGQSGNPRGRPKGSRNLSTLMAKALNEPVVISENGKRKRITKREAVLKQLVNKAASGDAKAIHFCWARSASSRAANLRQLKACFLMRPIAN
jgi:hypothetical protein